MCLHHQGWEVMSVGLHLCGAVTGALSLLAPSSHGLIDQCPNLLSSRSVPTAARSSGNPFTSGPSSTRGLTLPSQGDQSPFCSLPSPGGGTRMA